MLNQHTMREMISPIVLAEHPEIGALRRKIYAERQRARQARGLPSWATRRFVPSNRVMYDVDPDKFYPQLLDELGFNKIGRYELEVAYQCMKMDMQVAHGDFAFTIHVMGSGDRKMRWNYTMHPGRDEDVSLATKHLEARAHYLRIRGFIPR